MNKYIFNLLSLLPGLLALLFVPHQLNLISHFNSEETVLGKWSQGHFFILSDPKIEPYSLLDCNGLKGVIAKKDCFYMPEVILSTTEHTTFEMVVKWSLYIGQIIVAIILGGLLYRYRFKLYPRLKTQ